MRHVTAHALGLLLFAAATAAWLWPVLMAPAAAVPGSGAGDNFLFVWNLWWTKHSLLAGASPLWCPLLFVPFGVDLTLDTHTLLPTAIAGLFAHDALAGTNAIIAAHLFFNFAAGYALAWRTTRDWPAAVLAGLFLGWSPYVTTRLLGHFNLIAVWVFPLTALLASAALAGSRGAAVLLGLTLGAIIYIEYYYAVYAAALVMVLVVAYVCTVEPRQSPARWPHRAVAILGVLIAAAVLLAAIVFISGGTVLRLGPLTASLRSAGNPIAAAWLLLLCAAAIAIGSRFRLRLDRSALGVHLRSLAPAIVVGLVVAMPLLAAGVRVWIHGDYTSQRYLWRSAPKGVDLATLVLGDPAGFFWDGGPLRAYARFGIDRIEQTAWFPPAALCLCATALWRRRRDATVRMWGLAASVFALWAAGPYVAAFGRTLPLPLPAILIRYIPVVANARIPGRAIVVVYIAVAVLAAVGFATLRERRHTTWALLLAALTVVDVVPSRPPLFAVDRPAIYETIRRHPEPGAICELPLGLRDSFGETGRFDSLMLWHQTLHDRPIAGGFISRLPPRITAGYRASPIFGPLLRLSAGDTDVGRLPGRDEAIDGLRQAGIRFVVLDRDTAPPALKAFVEQLRLPRIDRDARRDALLVVR